MDEVSKLDGRAIEVSYIKGLEEIITFSFIANFL